MRLLFIGGPRDGHRITFQSQFSNTIQIASFDGTFPSTIHNYQIRIFKNGNEEYRVAVHESIHNPMEALIKGYHYHRKPPGRANWLRRNKLTETYA